MGDTSEAQELVRRLLAMGLVTTVPGSHGQRFKLRSLGRDVLTALQTINEQEDQSANEG